MDGVYIGTVVAWASPRIPVDWMQCNGALLKISDYQALFSIIGTTYGGDGVTNFGLPNFGGTTPYGAKMGASGDSSVVPGKVGGQVAVQISAANMPMHSHATTVTPATGTYKVCNAAGNSTSPQNADLAQAAIYNTTPPDATIVTVQTPVSAPIEASDGVSQFTLTTMPPFLVVNYIICVNGLYPTPQ